MCLFYTFGKGLECKIYINELGRTWADTAACSMCLILASQLTMGANTDYIDTNPKGNAPFSGAGQTHRNSQSSLHRIHVQVGAISELSGAGFPAFSELTVLSLVLCP